MLSFKTVLIANTIEDSLRIELAKSQYIALQTDSALNAYYDITDALNIKIEIARKEINRHIKDKLIKDKVNKDLTISLVKANNALARSRKANLMWFGVGAGVGGVIGITGIISIAIVTNK